VGGGVGVVIGGGCGRVTGGFGFVGGDESAEASSRVAVSVGAESVGVETGAAVAGGSGSGVGVGWGSGSGVGVGFGSGLGFGFGLGFGLGFGVGSGFAADRGVVGGLLLCSAGAGLTVRAASEPAAAVGCVTGIVREISSRPPVELVDAWVEGRVETTAAARAWAAVA
jgi:hypothetical protein